MTVKRNMAANFAGQAFTSLLSLALVPTYIHYLTIEAYGLVGLFAVIQVWLSLLDLGMTPTLTREMARFSAGAVPAVFIRDLLHSLELICLGLAVIIAIVLTAGSGFLASHWLKLDSLSVETVARGLSLIGCVVAMRFCEGIYRSGIIGLQQQVWLNGASAALAVFRSGGAVVVLALVSPTIEAFFIWQGISSLLTLVVLGLKLHLALPRIPRRPRFSVDALREVRKFAGGMIGITVLGVMLTQIDKLVLSRMLPLSQFGYYMLASSVTAGIYLAIGPIVQALYPTFVRLTLADDERHLVEIYHKTSQLVTVLVAPIVMLLVIFSRGILFAWSGDPVLASKTAPILAMLSIGTFLNALMQVPHQLQLSVGWTSLALKMNLVATVVLVPALIWSVPLYGPVAAASVWALLNAGYLAVGIPLLHRRLLPGEMGRWYLDDVAFPTTGAGVAVLLASSVAPALDNRLEWIVFAIVTGFASTFFAMLMASLLRRRLGLAVGYALTRRYRRG